MWRGSFAGKPDELIEQALKLDAHNADALMLAGGSAYQRKQLTTAVAYWEKINLKQLEKEDQEWVLTQIKDVKEEISGVKKQESGMEQYHDAQEPAAASSNSPAK